MISTRPARTNDGAVPSLLATAMPDGAVRCGVCAHRCLVRPGRIGICGVRENRDGALVLARPTGPRSRWPWTRSRRSRSSTSRPAVGRTRSRRPAARSTASSARTGRSPRARGSGERPPARVAAAGARRRRGARARRAARSPTPTSSRRSSSSTRWPSRDRARAAGLLNLFITDGYATPEAIDLLATVLDAANVDLKSFDDAFYRRRCGARLAHVLEALEGYRRAGVWLEVTTLVIPGENDDPARAARADRLARHAPGPRDAVARQPLLPGLPDAGPPADAAGHAPAGRRDRS